MLRLIDRYLIREIVPYILLALLLLTAIIFAQEASRFSEMLVISSRKGLPMLALWQVMAALIPGILVFTLPISLLIGTLVGLGRLSGDSEIVALGASGVSRVRILRPVVAVALIIACTMLYITFTILPRSMKRLTDLKANRSLVFQGLNSEIRPRVFEESVPKKVLYVEDIDRARDVWHNIFLVDLGDDTNDIKIFTASSGSLRQGQRSDMPELYLKHGSVHQVSNLKPIESRNPSASGEIDPQGTPAQNPPFRQNGDQQTASEKERERKKSRGQQSYTFDRFEEMTFGLDVADDKRSDASGTDQQADQVEQMDMVQLIRYEPSAEQYHEWRAEIHKRIALPAACLVFAMLAVGLGISHVRTGRSFGLLLGLAITVVYYLLALSGQHAALSGRLPVWFGIWLANIVLASLGLLIILAQRRVGSDALSMLSSLRHFWNPAKDAENGRGVNGVREYSQFFMETGGNKVEPISIGTSTISRRSVASVAPRLPVAAAGGRRKAFRLLPRPQLIDRLVLSDLIRFFLFIVAGFSILIMIITLFQLLNYIARNNIEWTVVVNYLLFLMPMIINAVSPLAALVAVMVTFGILQKTSQVVALTASGQSIYRLAAPALVASILLSCLVFVNQDYILPFTNLRQNNLRHLIRSGQEPPQTFYQTTKQWIFGYESRIYNYKYFDPKSNSFLDFNVIDLSREPFGIKNRLNARRAEWDEPTQEWVLKDGWQRSFEADRLVQYEQFKEKRLKLAEGPDYFKKDWRGSSSMTLADMHRRIADLSRSGFPVLEMRIALQSKIAFPITCLVMVLVGLPFSFSVGKRGALVGVTVGIAIGLIYWGLLGLFEQMGRYEMLPPMLAAWGPNLLFGATGIYLFLTRRT
jgi:lipopolysaccharide export system permease protein